MVCITNPRMKAASVSVPKRSCTSLSASLWLLSVSFAARKILLALLFALRILSRSLWSLFICVINGSFPCSPVLLLCGSLLNMLLGSVMVGIDSDGGKGRCRA